MLSQIASESAETMVTDQLANLAPGAPQLVHALPICQPHTLPVTQEIIPTEMEEQSSFPLQTTQNSKLILNENNPVEVFMADILGNVKELKATEMAPTVQITPEIKPSQTIETNVVVSSEDVADLVLRPNSVLNANINCDLFEATTVSENISSEMEGILPQLKSISEHAKPNLVPVQAIQIAKVDDIENETDLVQPKSVASNAVCEIPTRESVEVSQTFVEFKPDKYYPEIVVATEVASSDLVEHRTYETIETCATEKEDTYKICSQ